MRVEGAMATGALQRGHVPVTIALAPRHKGAPARGGGLTPGRFNARFAASKATVRAVRRWARAR